MLPESLWDVEIIFIKAIIIYSRGGFNTPPLCVVVMSGKCQENRLFIKSHTSARLALGLFEAL